MGGTPAVLKYLLEKNMIDGSTLTCTGRTLAENLATCRPLAEGQQVIMPVESPIKTEGHLQILYGNLAPEGSGESLLRFRTGAGPLLEAWWGFVG